MLDMLSVTRYRFSKFLNALYDEYGQKIRHIVIILLPDLGRAAAITSQKFGLEPERIAIVDPRAKRIVSEIAEKVNGAWLEEAQEFHERTGIKIVAIDTFKDSLFRKDDQHLNRAGREAIAEEAYDRTVFSAT
ncbi:MAG: SGNH/GDSL hydrolase family protein [Candidatus Curtissbacteria bacterium]|nr:SGNH/GDSL hydrolase family protein [Candidatus Curtissbacteria bacterium]